jgi:hypothetical protein
MMNTENPENSSFTVTSEAKQAEQVCYMCRKPVKTTALSCPHCGRILEKLLLESLDPQSFSPPEEVAYQKGAGDCLAHWQATKDTAVPRAAYQPVPGNEDHYRAGWQAEAEKLDRRAERMKARRRGSMYVFGGLALVAFSLPGLISGYYLIRPTTARSASLYVSKNYGAVLVSSLSALAAVFFLAELFWLMRRYFRRKRAGEQFSDPLLAQKQADRKQMRKTAGWALFWGYVAWQAFAAFWSSGVTPLDSLKRS